MLFDGLLMVFRLMDANKRNSRSLVESSSPMECRCNGSRSCETSHDAIAAKSAGRD